MEIRLGILPRNMDGNGLYDKVATIISKVANSRTHTIILLFFPSLTKIEFQQILILYSEGQKI